MPAALRTRLALVALLGAFLIPVTLSSLRGLAHVVTCSEEATATFAVELPLRGGAVIISAVTVVRADPVVLCGGLSVNPSVRPAGDEHIDLVLPITNSTPHRWQGTVRLELGDLVLPIRIGSIGPGQTVSESVRVRVGRDATELRGSLLVGP